MTIHADLASHHIEGYAVAAMEAGLTQNESYFDVPLISHIVDNLYMGGCLNEVPLPEDFAHVVSLYPWEKYALGEDTQRVEVRLYDAAEIPPAAQLYEIADHVIQCLTEGKTLVHCQAGLNRSGLVSALTLMVGGMTAKDSIALLRAKRTPLVLCNQTFEKWLLNERV